MIRRLVMFTIPADYEWKPKLPPGCQYIVAEYEDDIGLQRAIDFEIFAARTARLMFQHLDWDRAEFYSGQERLKVESLERDAALAMIPVTPETRAAVDGLAANIRQAVIAQAGK